MGANQGFISLNNRDMTYKYFNRILAIGSVSAMLLVAVYGCKKNDGIVVAPQAALFANSKVEGTYFIPDDPNSTFKIPVGVTAASDRDVTFNFTVSSPSGAVEGQQYTLASKSVTIPAGKTVDSIQLKGLFDGYAGGRRDTLIFTISGGETPTVSGSNKYTLILQQFCPLVMSDFEGDFKIVQDDWEDYAPGTTVPLTVDGNKILFYYAVANNANRKAIEIIVDPNTFKTSVLPQTYGSYSGATVYSAKSAESDENVVVPCDKKITVILDHSGSNGSSYAGLKLVLQKQ